jgi:hypothetical protein
MRLRVPKLRARTFETAITERYGRRESSVEEALIEMYLAGVSVRRVEDITEALWGTRVSPSTVSDLNKKIYGTIEAWRNRPIEGEHPYLDGIVLKRSWAGEVRNVSLLVAIRVNGEGYREILLFAWRKAARAGLLTSPADAALMFVPGRPGTTVLPEPRRTARGKSPSRLPARRAVEAVPHVMRLTCPPWKLTRTKVYPRRPCSPSQRRLTSISAATASQCSTKAGHRHRADGSTLASRFS